MITGVSNIDEYHILCISISKSAFMFEMYLWTQPLHINFKKQNKKNIAMINLKKKNLLFMIQKLTEGGWTPFK